MIQTVSFLSLLLATTFAFDDICQLCPGDAMPLNEDALLPFTFDDLLDDAETPPSIAPPGGINPPPGSTFPPSLVIPDGINVRHLKKHTEERNLQDDMQDEPFATCKDLFENAVYLPTDQCDEPSIGELSFYCGCPGVEPATPDCPGICEDGEIPTVDKFITTPNGNVPCLIIDVSARYGLGGCTDATSLKEVCCSEAVTDPDLEAPTDAQEQATESPSLAPSMSVSDVPSTLPTMAATTGMPTASPSVAPVPAATITEAPTAAGLPVTTATPTAMPSAAPESTASEPTSGGSGLMAAFSTVVFVGSGLILM